MQDRIVENASKFLSYVDSELHLLFFLVSFPLERGINEEVFRVGSYIHCRDFLHLSVLRRAPLEDTTLPSFYVVDEGTDGTSGAGLAVASQATEADKRPWCIKNLNAFLIPSFENQTSYES